MQRTQSYIGCHRGEAVVDQRKQAVSIRLGESDIRNIKRIAKRLGVRDSDIIRFAIKSALNRLGPLCDDSMRGRNLVPVLVESGDELIRYFELDSFRLENIINEDVQAEQQVDRFDIALLAMSGLREEYLVMHLKAGDGHGAESAVPARSLRGYLYDKYVYRNTAHRTNGAARAEAERPLDEEPNLRGQHRQPAA